MSKLTANKLTTILCAVVAANAILPVSGATTGAENVVPRSEYDIGHLYGATRHGDLYGDGHRCGGSFDHRFGPHQGHLRRHRHRLPLTFGRICCR